MIREISFKIKTELLLKINKNKEKFKEYSEKYSYFSEIVRMRLVM